MGRKKFWARGVEKHPDSLALGECARYEGKVYYRGFDGTMLSSTRTVPDYEIKKVNKIRLLYEKLPPADKEIFMARMRMDTDEYMGFGVNAQAFNYGKNNSRKHKGRVEEQTGISWKVIICSVSVCLVGFFLYGYLLYLIGGVIKNKK